MDILIIICANVCVLMLIISYVFQVDYTNNNFYTRIIFKTLENFRNECIFNQIEL